MNFLRASSDVDPRTTAMAAEILRIRRGPFRKSGRIEAVEGDRVCMNGTDMHVMVHLPKGPLDAPGDHPKRLDAHGWRTLVGRCRRACLRHSEIGLPVADDELAIDVAFGLLDQHSDILRDDDTISVQVPTPWAALRYRMGTAGMPIGGPAIIPADWNIPHVAMMELMCDRGLDRIAVSLQPICHVWKVQELKAMDPIARMRAVARLMGAA